TATAAPRMNMSPPMVGVPCLDICQVGPISLMDCPAFIRRRKGIRAFPARAVTTKAARKAAAILIFEPPYLIPPKQSHGEVFYHLLPRFTIVETTVSRPICPHSVTRGPRRDPPFGKRPPLPPARPGGAARRRPPDRSRGPCRPAPPCRRAGPGRGPGGW